MKNQYLPRLKSSLKALVKSYRKKFVRFVIRNFIVYLIYFWFAPLSTWIIPYIYWETTFYHILTHEQGRVAFLGILVNIIIIFIPYQVNFVEELDFLYFFFHFGQF